VKAYFNDRDLQEADAMSKTTYGWTVSNLCGKCFKSALWILMIYCWRLMNCWPVSRKCSQIPKPFRYILVDEYQDTNHSQYLIVRALSDKFQNICVVGDDAQSIYAFRGMNINNILNFQKDYEGVKLSWNKITDRQKHRGSGQYYYW
jgi:DNA helicase-2/ATP-dependent DNA helicase PcrA